MAGSSTDRKSGRGRKGKQLSLDLRRHGGPRPGAGRKRKSRRAQVPHRCRPAVSPHHPVHATVRVLPHVWSLRSKRCYRVVHSALWAGCKRPGFRIAQFSVQGNHIHLIVEANGRRRLSRGIQGLTVRLARALNKVMRRKGTVFADRYHSRVLRTPREVRNALSYVLNNIRRHARAKGERLPSWWIDPYSSAIYFGGWRDPPVVEDQPWLPTSPRPVCSARAWLLRVGWRRSGLLRVEEVPGTRSR